MDGDADQNQTEEATPEADHETDRGNENEDSQAPEINLQSALTKAVNAVADDDGWATPGAVGNHLRRTHPSLDPRNYGHRGLEALLRDQPFLESATEGKKVTVRLKGHGNAKQQKAVPKVTATEEVGTCEVGTCEVGTREEGCCQEVLTGHSSVTGVPHPEPTPMTRASDRHEDSRPAPQASSPRSP